MQIKNRQSEWDRLPVLIHNVILFTRPDDEGKDLKTVTKVTDKQSGFAIVFDFLAPILYGMYVSIGKASRCRANGSGTVIVSSALA